MTATVKESVTVFQDDGGRWCARIEFNPPANYLHVFLHGERLAAIARREIRVASGVPALVVAAPELTRRGDHGPEVQHAVSFAARAVVSRPQAGT